MGLTKGSESLACSARECTKAAVVALIWSNPQIHYGRHKTWLACEAHSDYLQQYLAARNFPVKILPLTDYLAEVESGSSSETIPDPNLR